MNVIRWRPYGDLLGMTERFNRFFEDGLVSRAKENNDSMFVWSPSADVHETKDEYVFRLEVPGMGKDDINVELNNDVLVIKGEKKERIEKEDEKFHLRESYSGSFSRSFTIPGDVDSGKIDAKMKDGVLELKIPKAEEKKPKAIKIM